LLMKGVINGVSIWNDDLTLAEVQELFNDGVPLDATAHSKEANLKGYWRNDGASSWSDRQDNVTANNGTVDGSPGTILLPEGTTSGKDILGFPLTHTNNGWLNLSGSEYVDVADNSVLDFQSAFTIECWINMVTNSSSYGMFITKRSSATYSGNDGYGLGWGAAPYLRIYYWSGSSEKQIQSTVAIVEGTWYHVAATIDTGGTQKIYVSSTSFDSSPASETNTGNIDVNTASLRIGYGNSDYFDGTIDEVRLYNRVLTASELEKNYKHGKSKHS